MIQDIVEIQVDAVCVVKRDILNVSVRGHDAFIVLNWVTGRMTVWNFAKHSFKSVHNLLHQKLQLNLQEYLETLKRLPIRTT